MWHIIISPGIHINNSFLEFCLCWPDLSVCWHVQYIHNTAWVAYLFNHMPWVDLGKGFISPQGKWKLFLKPIRGIWLDRCTINVVLYLLCILIPANANESWESTVNIYVNGVKQFNMSWFFTFDRLISNPCLPGKWWISWQTIRNTFIFKKSRKMNATTWLKTIVYSLINNVRKCLSSILIYYWQKTLTKYHLTSL